MTTTRQQIEPLSAPAPVRTELTPELELELRRAVEEIERGKYIDLSPDELDRWADSGVSPWPSAFPD